MRLTIQKLPARQVCLVVLTFLLIFVFLGPGKVRGQRNPSQAVAQVGPASPLPVFVVNDVPALPEGFIPGSSWKFTTWTIPSTLTFTASVEKTEGGWALLKLTTDTTPRWYFIPQMPGAWEPQ